MKHGLCEAAITGNVESLRGLIKKDALILDKVAAGCFNDPSPLHVATSNNQLHFVEELLDRKRELTEVLDSQLRSALYLASAKGHSEIVKVLVKFGPEMCLVRNREGKNPLHVAAERGNINVLEELVRANPQAARVRVDRNETILHLCVKNNQLKSLEILKIQGEELANAKDNDGNTILHLAVLDTRLEITSHVLKNTTTDVNAKNASGHTAMDIFFLLQAGSNKKDLDLIEDLLRKANANHGKDLEGGHWSKKKQNSLMVVASLIATMAFQAGVNPPGGVWQDDKDGHKAGEAVMAYKYPGSYPYFLRFNMIGFVASLSTILLLNSGLKFKNKASLSILIGSMWLAITSMAITYAFSNVMVTPDKDKLSLSFVIAVIVWSSVMTLPLIYHTYHLVAIFVKEERSTGWHFLRKRPSATDGGANPPQSSSDRWSILRKHLSIFRWPIIHKRRSARNGGANSPLPVSSVPKGD